MSKEIKKKKPLKVIRGSDYRTIYSEGLSQVRIGSPVSRFMLRSLATEQEDCIVHQVECEVVIPTAALIEVALQFLDLIKNKEGELIDATEKYQNAFSLHLDLAVKSDLNGYSGKFEESKD